MAKQKISKTVKKKIKKTPKKKKLLKKKKPVKRKIVRRKIVKKTAPTPMPVIEDPINLPGHSDEESALRLTRLYYREIARLGHKRSLDLDAIINTYLYALSRLDRKEIEIKEIVEAVKKENIKQGL